MKPYEEAQRAYNLMVQASWAAERCGASEQLTACVMALQAARYDLARHGGVARFDYTGPTYGELFGKAMP